MGENIFVDHALYRLAELQGSDGSWPSLSSPDPDSFQTGKTYRTTFSTSLILSCLGQLPASPLVTSIKTRAAAFLLAQKSSDWTWNYWVRQSPEYTTWPYPDDVDDTFCALAAIQSTTPSAISGHAMAKIVTGLTQIEVQPGGPYRTWYAAADAPAVWNDVDLAVNSNVEHFLALQGVRIPHLTQLFEQAITAKQLTSPYYPNAFPIVYFIARSYDGQLKKNLINFLFAQQTSGHWDSPLHTALAVSALIRIGTPPAAVARAIANLEQTHSPAGWPAQAFCLDPTIHQQPHYSGSVALTTAFCLEALCVFHASHFSTTTVSLVVDVQSEQLITTVKQRFKQTDSSIQATAHELLKTISTHEIGQQILRLPFQFHAALDPSLQTVPASVLQQLALATIYGWMAYTVYDDFYDAEAHPGSLGTANICLRELTQIVIVCMATYTEFLTVFHAMLDQMENSTSWEIHHARFDPSHGYEIPLPRLADFPSPADKSMGHAIGPLAIMAYLGFGSHSPTFQSVENFFRQYLSARQRLDDMHDWEKDLQSGQLTPIVVSLLQSHPSHPLEPDRMTQLKKTFWHTLVIPLCVEIEQDIQAARTALQNPIFHQPKYFESLLNTLDRSIQTTRNERQQMLDFLSTYQSKSADPSSPLKP